MGTNIGEKLMGRMADLDAELHELPDFEKGVQSEYARILNLLTEEFDALVELGSNANYLNGVDHAINLLKGKLDGE
jgi:hypothetical protein